ncbi:HEPN domain-containing protein [Grimontia hollisae]|uniref:HEPN domain-containing protein n=1 Tax=Grimontia hollisae TaxID=673 RepID=UPI0023DA7CB5|nr:HEPN domain-containing protein [Grimontia hollisae]MDF2185228.1 HEPN domain-containing protein [Grimontia hollisae]
MEINTSERLTALHSELLNELSHTYNAYLSPNLTNDLSVNPNWERDKKSLILLTHAALENYIEVISLILIEDAEHHFKYHNKINEPLLYFTWLKCNSKPSFSDEDWKETSREILKKELEEAIRTYKNEVYKNNHGIKIKNLNNLLRPLSLELPNNPTLTSSLDELTNLRGEFAHRFLEKGTMAQRIQNKKGPEEIQRIVINSYRLAYRLYLSSLAKIADENSKIALRKEIVIQLKNYIKERKETEGKHNSLFSINSKDKSFPSTSISVIDIKKTKKRRKKKKNRKRRSR